MRWSTLESNATEVAFLLFHAPCFLLLVRAQVQDEPDIRTLVMIVAQARDKPNARQSAL